MTFHLQLDLTNRLNTSNLMPKVIEGNKPWNEKDSITNNLSLQLEIIKITSEKIITLE